MKDYRRTERKRETDASDLEFMLNGRKGASEVKAVNVILN